MPKKVPLVSIGVARDGKTVYPPIGKPFDFTKEEVADMDKLAKSDRKEYYRDPLNEDSPAAEDKKAAAAKSGDKKAADASL